MTDQPALDFGLMNDKVSRLLQATGNRLEREWPVARPQHGGAQAAVVGIFMSARNSYSASRYILADTPPNPARRLEYSLAAAPLVRSLVELLGTAVFLFDDLETRPVEFFKGGLRTAIRDTERLRETRGSDPSWAGILEKRDADLARMKVQFALSPIELADPVKELPSWTQLYGLASRLTGERRAYLEYLHDWFYQALSLDSHPTWLGLGKALALLGNGLDEEDRKSQLDMVRTKHATASLALVLSLVTEIEREFGFGEMADLKYVWSVLSSWDPDVRDFYSRIYVPVIGSAEVSSL